MTFYYYPKALVYPGKLYIHSQITGSENIDNMQANINLLPKKYYKYTRFSFLYYYNDTVFAITKVSSNLVPIIVCIIKK